MEEIISWLVPIIGVYASWFVSKRKPITSTKFLSSIGVSLLMMVVFIVASSLANTVCIDTFDLCSSHGDRNIGYWFNSFFLLPVYLIAALIGESQRA